MAYISILYKYQTLSFSKEAPLCFHDLLLDKIIRDLLVGMEAYDLSAFFYTPVRNVQDIQYRQEILQEMEIPGLFAGIEAFTQSMQQNRVLFAETQKLIYARQKKGLFLDFADRYCKAVESFAQLLTSLELKSAGFLELRDYFSSYLTSDSFLTLKTEARQLVKALTAVRYSIIIKELEVQIRSYNAETDFSKEISGAFDRFKQNPVKDYHRKLECFFEMNHVEASILEGVVTLYPDLFQALDIFCEKNENYIDPVIKLFDREIHFYMVWLYYTEKLKGAGLQFCSPVILTKAKDMCSDNSFDIALATTLVDKKYPVVCNDFYLAGNERIIVITGPNQGGKTTLAKTIGQLHYLASLGLSVPGSNAGLFLCDEILTHFEKEEDLAKHRSKLEDDLVRIHQMLAAATTKSILIFNEILSSTSLQDALFLGKKIIEAIDRLDCVCVWVTFMDDLVGFSTKTVSMASTVQPGDPAVKTFKVIRKPADGLAYALSLAEKHQLTYTQLKKNLSHENPATL